MTDEAIQRFPIRLRTADETDVPFIFKSWHLSFQGQNRHIPKTIIDEYEPPIIQKLLNENITLMCVGDTDASSGDIYGFICAQRCAGALVVHYIYVKAGFRQWGLAKAMLGGFDYKQGELIFHSYKMYTKLIKELKYKGYNCIYNPYLKEVPKEKWTSWYEDHRASIE